MHLCTPVLSKYGTEEISIHIWKEKEGRETEKYIIL